jgi:SAM-dependent methyltransferase
MTTGTPGFLRLMRFAGGFRESKIILAANEYEIFTELSGRSRSAKELAQEGNLDCRALTVIMDALVAMRLLAKEHNQYRNSEAAETYLVKNRPEYMGELLKFMNVYWKHWGDLENVIKKGRMNCGTEMLDQSDPQYNHVYIWAMDNIGKKRAEMAARLLDIAGVRKMLDIGGGAATYSIAFAKINPKLTSVVLDLPVALKVACENIERNGLSERIRTRAESYWEAEYKPEFDLVLISQIIHGLSGSQGEELVRRASTALSPGGRLIVHDSLLVEDRTAPYHGALFAANMLAITEHGRCYTVEEVSDWAKKAGLKNIRRIGLDSESEMVEGVR